ncbi:MAG TPA: T9SS type A sorting domain-containing protein [Bacteroidaceae bacterium]|nr:T9SS type A sorting domain-containing protein [Bacteroidaceae bacterium]
MKIHLLLSFLIVISFSSISFAQITREQTDEIVYKYITDEGLRTDGLLLYTTDYLPNAEGISTITNSKNEVFGVEYPCWVYYINEWMDVNGPYFRRYLFINKTTGNILEVKTRKDFGPSDPNLDNWQLIYPVTSGLSDIDDKLDKLYFPNPVSDFLEIACKKDFEYVVIFDLQGKQVFQEIFNQLESNQKFDVSSLNRGFYVVNVFDTTKKILSFKILKR